VRFNDLQGAATGVFQAPARCGAAVQDESILGPVVPRSLEDHRVLQAHFLRSKPADFGIDLSVAAGTSSPRRRRAFSTFRGIDV
jgi:hypothetical protein